MFNPLKLQSNNKDRDQEARPTPSAADVIEKSQKMSEGVVTGDYGRPVPEDREKEKDRDEGNKLSISPNALWRMN